MKKTIQTSIACLYFALICTNCRNKTSSADQAAPITRPTIATPTVVDAIKVEPVAPPIFKAYAKGYQIYKCDSIAPDQYAWKFDRPEATLYDDHDVKIGTHYKNGGPAWESADGSIVIANGDKATIKADTSHPGNIPGLLLQQKAYGGNKEGVFGRVTKIQRVDTHQGKAPSGLTGSAYKGTELYMPYTATYYFYE